MMKPENACGAVILALSVVQVNPAHAAALSLDGDGDYVEFAGAGVPAGNAPFTIGAWINPTSIPSGGANGGQVTFWGTQGPPNTANGLRTRGEWGARHYFWGNDHDGNFTGSILADSSHYGHTGYVGGAPNNGWHHLAVTYDSTQTVLYWNGAPLGSPRVVSGGGANVAALNHRIGSRLDAEYFHGFIDEVSIWNIPLSAAEIASGWDQPIDPDDPTIAPFLVAYWDFEGAGEDLAGGDNVLTFQGDSLIDSTADALIPEPAPVLLGLVGSLLVLIRRRRS